ncbi:MAG: hypothetical protein AAF480_01085, partial [Actinomycetota bacterium]
LGGVSLWRWIIVRVSPGRTAPRGPPVLVLVTTAGAAAGAAADDDLTFEDVQAEFEAAGPAPSEA